MIEKMIIIIKEFYVKKIVFIMVIMIQTKELNANAKSKIALD